MQWYPYYKSTTSLREKLILALHAQPSECDSAHNKLGGIAACIGRTKKAIHASVRFELFLSFSVLI